MSSVFPLLNTPRLVSSEVFNMMEPHELVAVSLCSRKARKLIKDNQRKATKRDISIRDNESSIPHVGRVVIFNDYYNYKYELYKLLGVEYPTEDSKNYETVEIGGFKVPVSTNGFLITHWDDKIFGLKKVAHYVCDLFNEEIGEVMFKRDSFPIIEWVNSRQERALKFAGIAESSILTEDEAHQIFTKCNVTGGELQIISPIEPTFKYDGKLPNVESFSFRSWVTIDHLLPLNFKIGIIKESTWTSSGVNKFLKQWMSGSFSKLKWFDVRFQDIIPNEIFMDLQQHMTRVYRRRRYQCVDGYEARGQGFDLLRSDGVTATIFCYPQGGIKIGVWPDSTGYDGKIN